MRGAQQDACEACAAQIVRGGQAGPAPASVAPGATFIVIPAAILKAGDQRSVSAATVLTNAGRPFEPDPAAKLRPVQRVEPTECAADRHGWCGFSPSLVGLDSPGNRRPRDSTVCLGFQPLTGDGKHLRGHRRTGGIQGQTPAVDIDFGIRIDSHRKLESL
jgi:hypothetical protein